jgi:branched-chain amino acid transport system substrate-binding protein
MRKSPQIAAFAASVAVVAALAAGPAGADLKLAYIDPLSGGAASAGINAQKHFIYEIDKINAAGGLNGEKLSIVFYDNKVDPQESLIALKKALDEAPATPRATAARWRSRSRTPCGVQRAQSRQGSALLQLCGDRSGADQRQVQLLALRFDSDVDMKMTALVNWIVTQPQVKKVYLINQDYSFGKAVAAAAHKMLAEKRPDIQIVGDELHPLQKVQDFSPYVAKIKASGADSVITGNWSNDMFLLLKAGKDAGLKVTWYTYYADALGAPTAIGREGNGVVKVVTSFHWPRCPSSIRTSRPSPSRFTGKEDEFAYYRLNLLS